MTLVHLLGTYDSRARYGWPCHAEPKVDGWRALAMCDEAGAWSMLTREGRDVSAICSPILRSIERALPGAAGLVLDGELAAHTWLDTKAEFDNRRLVSTRFHVWDVLPLADYEQGRCAQPIESRRATLEGLGLSRAKRWVSVVKQEQVDSPEAFSAFYERMLAKGWEGAVLKMRGTPWALCRDHWYKLKPCEGRP